MRRLVDLSHPIAPGQITHPGMPAPRWRAFRSRDDYRSSNGTEFQVDEVVMVGNTGTYLDSPAATWPGEPPSTPSRRPSWPRTVPPGSLRGVPPPER